MALERREKEKIIVASGDYLSHKVLIADFLKTVGIPRNVICFVISSRERVTHERTHTNGSGITSQWV